MGISAMDARDGGVYDVDGLLFCLKPAYDIRAPRPLPKAGFFIS